MGTVKRGYKGRRGYKGQILGKSSSGSGWHSELQAPNMTTWYQTLICQHVCLIGHFHVTVLVFMIWAFEKMTVFHKIWNTPKLCFCRINHWLQNLANVMVSGHMHPTDACKIIFISSHYMIPIPTLSCFRWISVEKRGFKGQYNSMLLQAADGC